MTAMRSASSAAELGIDLAGVRVHTGAHAGRVAAELGARAVTIGDDIFFAAGAYDPESPAGIELIAHEIAHVAQQQRGGPVDETRVSRPDDAHEQDADRFAATFTAAPSLGVTALGEPGGAGQRADANSPAPAGA